ncbi:unnamed protein product [Discula destructiva]
MFIKSILPALALFGLANAVALPSVQEARQEASEPEILDAIIVGGGPAGLSALSGLARVRRKAVLIDSGEYRNGATRHMHDVIGFDGVTPAYFRWLAREKLASYPSVSMTNGTVTSIDSLNSTNPSFSAQVVYPSGEVATLTARSIVLAIGLKDILPDTLGVEESWGQGIYWCPWCDGYEHVDQALGLLAPLTDVAELVREVSTQNSDVVAFVNGTDTPEARSTTEASFANWQTYLEARNVKVYNQTITQITHLVSGLNTSNDPSLPTYPEYDLFRVDLDDGTSVDRAAFLVSFPDEQKSAVGTDMGVDVIEGRLAGNQSTGYLTNIPLVYAVGDNNIDRSTNVPHAMYSGKRAAVYLHVALARQEALAEIAAAEAGNGTAVVEKRARVELDPRDVWDEMNDAPGTVFHSAAFDPEL